MGITVTEPDPGFLSIAKAAALSAERKMPLVRAYSQEVALLRIQTTMIHPFCFPDYWVFLLY